MDHARRQFFAAALLIHPLAPPPTRWEELRQLTIRHGMDVSDFVAAGRYCGVFTPWAEYLAEFSLDQLRETFWQLGYRQYLDPVSGEYLTVDQLNQAQLLNHLLTHFQTK